MRVLMVLAIGWPLIAALPADACKYTVRDVAFVTAGEPDYRLLVYVDDAAAARYAELRTALGEVLADANIAAQVVTLGEVEADDAAGVAERVGIASAPSGALVAADGRSLRIDVSDLIGKDGALAVGGIETLRGKLLETPGQARLKELLLLGHHSVIVVLEGTDAATNRAVDTMVQSAIQEVDDSLELLPKPMELGPASITLTRDEIEREAVLLWALGFDLSETATAPQAAILMGRCRLLGPAMILPDEHQSFRRRLVLVGQDCECELDRSVMQGTMLPHAWTILNESQAAKTLGFDPGNPLVQAEVHRILARGPRSGGGELPTLRLGRAGVGGLADYRHRHAGGLGVRNGGSRNGCCCCDPGGPAGPGRNGF